MSGRIPLERQEINRRIAEARRGKPHPHKPHPCSAETRRKIGLVHRGNKYCLGLKRSPENREKISRAKRHAHGLPLAEIAARYLAGETLDEVLKSYPPLPYAYPRNAIRRQLIRDGFQKKTREGNAAGSRNFQWRGGHTKTVHYYRRQSYEIAAICQGKPLEMGEIIHHDDEVPQNNAPENLLIFPNASKHLRYHQRLLNLQRQGKIVDTIQLAIENGARRLQRPSCLIGWIPDITLQPLLEKMDRRTSLQRSLPSNPPQEPHRQ